MADSDHVVNNGEEVDEIPNQEEPVPMYANNTRFESTAWDLRLFFGQLAPGSGTEIDWHTDITIPWPQAKILHLYLGINIALYEIENGKINIPKSVLPTPLIAPAEGADMNDPLQAEFFQYIQRAVDEFRANQFRKP